MMMMMKSDYLLKRERVTATATATVRRGRTAPIRARRGVWAVVTTAVTSRRSAVRDRLGSTCRAARAGAADRQWSPATRRSASTTRGSASSDVVFAVRIRTCLYSVARKKKTRFCFHDNFGKSDEPIFIIIFFTVKFRVVLRRKLELKLYTASTQICCRIWPNLAKRQCSTIYV